MTAGEWLVYDVTSFAPIAVTPAALGDGWHNAMLQLSVHISINGQWFGSPNAGEETVFHFGQIIAHLAKTRALCAGSIIGAGTISNAAAESGNACITEARVRQILQGVRRPNCTLISGTMIESELKCWSQQVEVFLGLLIKKS